MHYYEDPITMLITAVIILVCLSLHELAHGWTAYKLGDMTAKQQGRLTLNPLKHLDPIGALMLFFFGFGYAKPVPVDFYQLKRPRLGMMLVAAAGPAANLLTAAVCMLILGFSTNSTLSEILITTAFMSAGLAVFNLIPIPPLDGSRILFALLPGNIRYHAFRLDWIGSVGLVILIATNTLTPYLIKAQEIVITLLSGFVLPGTIFVN